jgi:hypothetical protein
VCVEFKGYETIIAPCFLYASLVVVPIMGGGGRISCSHGHPKCVNASPIHWFSFFSRCSYALVSFVFLGLPR